MDGDRNLTQWLDVFPPAFFAAFNLCDILFHLAPTSKSLRTRIIKTSLWGQIWHIYRLQIFPSTLSGDDLTPGLAQMAQLQRGLNYDISIHCDPFCHNWTTSHLSRCTRRPYRRALEMANLRLRRKIEFLKGLRLIVTVAKVEPQILSCLKTSKTIIGNIMWSINSILNQFRSEAIPMEVLNITFSFMSQCTEHGIKGPLLQHFNKFVDGSKTLRTEEPYLGHLRLFLKYLPAKNLSTAQFFIYFPTLFLCMDPQQSKIKLKFKTKIASIIFQNDYLGKPVVRDQFLKAEVQAFQEWLHDLSKTERMDICPSDLVNRSVILSTVLAYYAPFRDTIERLDRFVYSPGYQITGLLKRFLNENYLRFGVQTLLWVNLIWGFLRNEKVVGGGPILDLPVHQGWHHLPKDYWSPDHFIF